MLEAEKAQGTSATKPSQNSAANWPRHDMRIKIWPAILVNVFFVSVISICFTNIPYRIITEDVTSTCLANTGIYFLNNFKACAKKKKKKKLAIALEKIRKNTFFYSFARQRRFWRTNRKLTCVSGGKKFPLQKRARNFANLNRFKVVVILGINCNPYTESWFGRI